MPSEKIAGTMYFWNDGQRFDIAGDIKYELPGEESEAMVGGDSSLHFKATPKEGMVEVELANTRDLMTVKYPQLVANNGNLNPRVELANGVQLTLTTARMMNRLVSSANEGKVTLKFCTMNMNVV